MNRKTEIQVIISKLKKDLCAKLSFISLTYPILNANNMNSFKNHYDEFTQIRTELEKYLNEYYNNTEK